MRQNSNTKISLFTLLALSFVCLTMQSAYSEEADGESLAETQSREEILSSERWLQAKQRFEDWLSIQEVYGDDQVEALKSELRNRIASMSAQQLKAFLPEMEDKLAVLMSQASMDARRWASKYTDKALTRIRAQYGVEDPIRMPSLDIEAALQKFAADRKSKASASAAFSRARQSQAKAATNYRQNQAAAAARSARKTANYGNRSSSAYAPRSSKSRVKTYSSAYPKLNYSVGPWGGVWVNPRR